MADDIWPYSQRNGGAVTDLEYEDLWSPLADGVLPSEPTNALAVGIAGSEWTVQPGRILVAGHVVKIDSVKTGALPTAAGSTRLSLVCVEIDHSQSPWTYGIVLVQGAPGGGVPALSTSQSGKYQVALRQITTATNGAQTLGTDSRPRLQRAGLKTLYDDPPFWRGYLAADQSLDNDAAWHVLGSVNQDYAENGTWEQDGHSSIRTFPYAGLYRMYAQCRFDPGGSSSHSLQIRFVLNPLSGTATGGTEIAVAYEPRGSDRNGTANLLRTYRMSAGGRIGTQVQLAGTASGVDRVAGTANTYIEFEWIRP